MALPTAHLSVNTLPDTFPDAVHFAVAGTIDDGGFTS
jgi:hypothetical protein